MSDCTSDTWEGAAHGEQVVISAISYKEKALSIAISRSNTKALITTMTLTKSFTHYYMYQSWN